MLRLCRNENQSDDPQNREGTFTSPCSFIHTHHNFLITRVSSDEPENGNGDGNTTNDIVIAGDCKSVQLRSECVGGGNGRVHRIALKVTDASGNVSKQPLR